MFPHDKLDWTLRRLEQRLEASPDDPSARADYARCALSKAMFHEGGEVWYNRALTAARRVLQADPGNVSALVVAGLSLSGLERLDHAQRYLDDALRTDAERADVHFSLGMLSWKLGDRHRAVRELEGACRLAPDSWEVHAMLGRLLGERADEIGSRKRLSERAQYHVVRALQLGPTQEVQPPLLYDLGVACLRTQRLDAALKLFTRLMENETWASRARYHLGLVNYHMGKYKNAILNLRQHLEERPDAHHVHARIGMAYLHLGEVTKAREACNRALAIDPSDVAARWTLGCAWLEEGHNDEAMRVFKEILADAPDHLPAFTELVRQRRDTEWLKGALRAEVSTHGRLPETLEREHPSGRGTIRIQPRLATRERIRVLLRALAELDSERAANGESGAGAVAAILGAMDLSADEGLRFLLWEAALDQLASTRAAAATARLKAPGRMYSAEAGREVLSLATAIPEAAISRGLSLDESDLKRNAVDRHGATRDVAKHRANIEKERVEARAWQALLLLALAQHDTRSSRNLLLRWASDADPELAEAALAGLVLQGEPNATATLTERVGARGHARLVEQITTELAKKDPHFAPRALSDAEGSHCTTCGRGSADAAHLIAGPDAVICNHCTGQIAVQRRELVIEEPSASCRLCGATGFEAKALYNWQGVVICAGCVDNSLGLQEREEVEAFLVAFA